MGREKGIFFALSRKHVYYIEYVVSTNPINSFNKNYANIVKTDIN